MIMQTCGYVRKPKKTNQKLENILFQISYSSSSKIERKKYPIKLTWNVFHIQTVFTLYFLKYLTNTTFKSISRVIFTQFKFCNFGTF